MSEEQQRFRQNRSVIDAIFTLRQVAEKAIEYSKPAYLCFIDLKQAFDRDKMKNVVTKLQEKESNRI
ncbi:hypothetical protein ANN_20369 [Periplaneta americana]|uniref:Reverse transcriptase domain-containing protein n=1 Tax=Periplaneta americana TaxID=6978 RepID=A0ABQ8SD30_PERAM|nr:hypothetical protein ANN_20369 [Periplaneta americana]